MGDFKLHTSEGACMSPPDHCHRDEWEWGITDLCGSDNKKLIWFETDMQKTSDFCRLSEQVLTAQTKNSFCLFIYLPSGWCKREMGRCAGGERPRAVQRTASCETDRDSEDENDTCRDWSTSRSCDQWWALTYVSRKRRVRPRKSGRRTGQDQTLPVTGATTEKQTPHDHDTRQGKSHTFRMRY